MGIMVYEEYSPADKIHRVSMRKASSSLRVPHRHSPSGLRAPGVAMLAHPLPSDHLPNPAGLLAVLNARQVQPQALHLRLPLPGTLSQYILISLLLFNIIFSVKPSPDN